MKRPKRYFLAYVGFANGGAFEFAATDEAHQILTFPGYAFDCETRAIVFSHLNLAELARLERRYGKDRDTQANAWDRYRAWKEQARAGREAMADRKLAADLPAKQLGSGQRILSSHRKAA